MRAPRDFTHPLNVGEKDLNLGNAMGDAAG